MAWKFVWTTKAFFKVRKPIYKFEILERIHLLIAFKPTTWRNLKNLILKGVTEDKKYNFEILQLQRSILLAM